MQAYILFTGPALFLMTAEFFLMIPEYSKGRRHRWLFSLVMILLILLPVRYMVERVKPFENKNRNPQWVKDLRKLKEAKTGKSILLNCENPVETMFYAGITAYPHLPGKEAVESLVTSGFRVLIQDRGNIPPDIKAMEGVSVIRLTGTTNTHPSRP
jgi:hypothetical protein